MQMMNNSLNQEAQLSFGEFDDGLYGNRFSGSFARDGQVSFEFTHDTEQDLTLYIQGYDVDYYGEVEVFLNGTSIGYLAPGANNDLTGSSFEIAAEDILAGSNEITFEVNGWHARAWGVTDLILLNAGTNVSTMAIDPEFTDDGWVTWQVGDKLYIGTYDPNSGALIEVLNESIGGALPFYETYYGAEFAMTANGPVALGISEAGIIYLDENVSYILEGTEGYRVGFLPKGDYDGLRFTMKPLDWWFTDEGENEVYLWDNGEVRRLEFEDATTRTSTWLNGSEVVVFSDTQMGVFNVDTSEITWIAPEVYEEGYVAAIETTYGEKYISILHEDGHTEIWKETDTGWELSHHLVIPEEVFGQYLFSPEFQEQDGKLYLMGISAELPTTTQLTAIVIYDLAEDTWAQVSDVQRAFDPEIVPLENGGFSLYYRNSADKVTEWFNISPEDLLNWAVPGTNPPNWYYGWHREAPGWHLEYGWSLERVEIWTYGWHLDWSYGTIWEWTYGEIVGWQYGWYKDWKNGWHKQWSSSWAWNSGGWSLQWSWTWDNGWWWRWDYGWDLAGDYEQGWYLSERGGSGSWVYGWQYVFEVGWYWGRSWGWIGEWDLGWYRAQGSSWVWAPYDGWTWIFYDDVHWDYGSYFGWDFSAQGGWGWTYDYWLYVNAPETALHGWT